MAEVPFFDLKPIVAQLRPQLDQAIASVLDSGQFIGGEFVESFEREFADYLGVAECVGVGNGLDAIRLSLEVAGVGPGDEVLVPGFTYYATWLAVLEIGAIPVPIDVNEFAVIDVALLEEALSERTRAIVPVHLFGIRSDIEVIRSFADAHHLAVVEDAAQAHGGRSANGQMLGAVGAFGAFSLYPTKNLGALGDAGVIATNDSAAAERLRSRRSNGRGADKYEHVDTGWNSRLDPFQAAILSVYLPMLEGWNARRREIAQRYISALGEFGSQIVSAAAVEASVWHHCVVRTSHRAEFRSYLASCGVGTDIHYPYSFDSVPALARFGASKWAGRLPHSERFGREVVSLPIGPWMSEVQIEQVQAALAGVPEEYFH